MYYKKPGKHAKDFVLFYLCKNCQIPYFAGHTDEIIDKEHLCLKCKKFPKAPEDSDSIKAVNLNSKIRNKILKRWGKYSLYKNCSLGNKKNVPPNF